MSNNYLFCVFIRGLPGAGKSFLTDSVTKYFEATSLDPDNLNLQYPKELLKKERLKILKYHALIDKGVDDLNKGISVAWGQPWRKVINIKKTADRILEKTNKIIRFLVIEIVIDKETSWKRCKKRFNSYTQFEEYVSKYQNYNLDFPHLELDGTKSTEKVTRDAVNWVQTFNDNKS